jgi:hypothetical protein
VCHGYWRRDGSSARASGPGLSSDGAPSLRQTSASGSSAGGWRLYPSGQVCPSRPSLPSAPSFPAGPGGPAGPAGPPGPGTVESAPGGPVTVAPAGPGGPGAGVRVGAGLPDTPGGPGGPDTVDAGPGGPGGPEGPGTDSPGSPRDPGGPATGLPPSCCTCCASASRAALDSRSSWARSCTVNSAAPARSAPRAARRSPCQDQPRNRAERRFTLLPPSPSSSGTAGGPRQP